MPSCAAPLRPSGRRSATWATRSFSTELAEQAGLDSSALMDVVTGSTTEAIYALNLENAVAGDVFGSPAYVLDGEVFWGQDRLELLDDALGSGREPYTPNVLRARRCGPSASSAA